MDTRLQFLITPGEYRANILRQKMYASTIRWKELRDEPLEEWERDFLRYQRSMPIPSNGRGRPPSGAKLSDAEYAVLRTSRLSETASTLNPSGNGAPRKHDNAEIALHVQSMIQFHGMGITESWRDAQRLFSVTKEQVRYAWKRYGDAAAAHLKHVR